MGKRVALVNASKCISTFEMIDLSEEDIDAMTQHYEEIQHATAVSATEVKIVRAKVTSLIPASAEDFILMLKQFSNLLHALFTGQFPYTKKCMELSRHYGVILQTQGHISCMR